MPVKLRTRVTGGMFLLPVVEGKAHKQVKRIMPRNGAFFGGRRFTTFEPANLAQLKSNDFLHWFPVSSSGWRNIVTGGLVYSGIQLRLKLIGGQVAFRLNSRKPNLLITAAKGLIFEKTAE